jgi:aminopeptidase
MTDPRVEKLASLLVNYSIGVKPKQKVLIHGESGSAPLLKELFKQCLQLGAYPFISPYSEEYFYTVVKYAQPEQFRGILQPYMDLMNSIDARFRIEGETNTRELTQLDPKKVAAYYAESGRVTDRMLEREAEGKLKWVLALFPTNAYAQDAEMSLAEYEDFVYNACMPDQNDPVGYWRKVATQQEKLVKWLKGKKSVHVTAPGTDLTLRIDGRPFRSCACEVNVPDGEVFTSPIENSANGHVHFTYPTNYQGSQVAGVRMEFKDGKCIKATAEKNEAYLNQMLDVDEGARFLGEFAIGTNEGITRATGQILFDEKIGGSFHMALGNSYPETLGVNKSKIHWDMICDLKQGGQITIDDQLVYKDGKFIIEL